MVGSSPVLCMILGSVGFSGGGEGRRVELLRAAWSSERDNANSALEEHEMLDRDRDNKSWDIWPSTKLMTIEGLEKKDTPICLPLIPLAGSPPTSFLPPSGIEGSKVANECMFNCVLRRDIRYMITPQANSSFGIPAAPISR